VEELVDIPNLIPPAAIYWRGLLLEMERLYNHIGDVAALLHDIAFDLVASEIAVLRERTVRLNAVLTDHRLLRGAIHPGGVAISQPEKLPEAVVELEKVVERFLIVVDKLVLANPSCRARAITTGILTKTEAKTLGATGLSARASGLWEQDFRLRHPQATYAVPEIGQKLRNLIRQTIADPPEPASVSPARRILVSRDDLRGDVFARLLLRAAEVETSVQLIGLLADALARRGPETALTSREILGNALKIAPNFEIGLGYVEGWRGDVFYFIMKGPGNTIFRCQVRDPSLYNWPALRQAVIRKPRERQNGADPKAPLPFWENILADFPLINKSFNLSYAGNDR
jgi:Ni,Fe-hydrogenase III large subunit